MGNVSIPSGGIFVFLHQNIVNTALAAMLIVSIPSGGIFVFLRCDERRPGRCFHSVSIPSGGIFVFLPPVEWFFLIGGSLGFNPVWRDFCFSTSIRSRHKSKFWPGFNPVWRDFCFSTPMVGTTRKRNSRCFNPVWRDFCFSTTEFLPARLTSKWFQSRLAGFLFFYTSGLPQ